MTSSIIRQKHYLYIITLFICWQFTKAQTVSLDLGKFNWQFREVRSKTWLKATVPGSVHTDLFNASKIPDPYFRDNESKLQWISSKDWEYKTTFNVNDSVLKKDIVEMLFNGLDTYADVYLNNYKLLTCDNFFRSYTIECKNVLKLGKNELRIVFSSAQKKINELKKSSKLSYESDYAYSRKPSYHFGWDWGPTFTSMGIWQTIELKAFNKAKIQAIQIKQHSLNANFADLDPIIELRSIVHQRAQIKLICLETNQIISKELMLQNGLNFISMPMRIKDPKWWWSNGLGEQALYHFKSYVEINGLPVDSLESYTGLRTIKIIQEPDSLGSSFIVELNGIKVFMKGANYIPQDMFLARPTVEDYQKTIEQAAEANMNMLRVWGGGFYEKDIFYKLCDEKGILVWQDFMFACALYPATESFLNNIKEELSAQIKRLRNHPSIALWCGNNENYIAWRDWGWAKRYNKIDSAKIWADYQKLFHEIIPEQVNNYDGSRFYWPSSPKYGWGYPVNKDGDNHYWGIWHGELPFEVFAKGENKARFMSEYGFQSVPDLNSVKKFTNESDRNIHSQVMKAHQKHRIGYPVIDRYLDRYYQKPKDFNSYLYASQVLQAFGIGMAIEIHRRSMPHTMGSLYWQYNDCWPVASWSSVDYYNSWKALHYKVKDLYQEQMISVVADTLNSEMINVFIVSDKLTRVKGLLKIKSTDFFGNVILKLDTLLELPANASFLALKLPKSRLLQGRVADETVVFSSLKVEQKEVAQNIFYFVYPKNLKLIKANLNYSLTKTDDGYQVELKTDKLIKNLYVSFPEIDGNFSDNYFDMLAGETRTLYFKTSKVIPNASQIISFKSLIDTY